MFAEELAALVAGAGEGGVAHFHYCVIVEERRQLISYLAAAASSCCRRTGYSCRTAQTRRYSAGNTALSSSSFAADSDEQRNVQAVFFDARQHTLRDIIYRQHDGGDVIEIAVMHVDDVAFSFKAAEGLDVGGNFNFSFFSHSSGQGRSPANNSICR